MGVTKLVTASLKRKLLATVVLALAVGALTASSGEAAVPMCQTRCNNQFFACRQGCGLPHDSSNPCYAACLDVYSACLDVCLR